MLCGTETDVGGTDKIGINRLPPRLLPIFIVGRWQWMVYADAGIVNDDIQSTEVPHYIKYGFFYLIGIGDICFNR